MQKVVSSLHDYLIVARKYLFDARIDCEESCKQASCLLSQQVSDKFSIENITRAIILKLRLISIVTGKASK